MRVLSKKLAAARSGIDERTLDREIERGKGPPTVHPSPRRVGIIDIDLDAWLLKRRRLPPGWVVEERPPQLTPHEALAGRANVETGEEDAEPHRSKATPNQTASASRGKAPLGPAKVDAEAPAQ
jgi:hypothetical protein